MEIEMALLTGGYLLALVLVLWWVFGAREGETEEWARAHALPLTPLNRPFVEHYLRTGRSLRALGVMGGFVLPALVPEALDPTPAPGMRSQLIGALVGYLIGTVWSELATSRPTTPGARAASLTPRRLDEYLPAFLRRASVVITACSLVFWTALLLVRHHPRAEGPVPSVGGAWAVRWMAVVVLTPAAIDLVQRWILRRPQPMVVPDLVAADDAVRSQSLHMLAGTGAAIELCWMIAPLWVLNFYVPAPLAFAPTVGSFGGGLAAIWFWRYCSHRAWRVQRFIPAVPTRSPVP